MNKSNRRGFLSKAAVLSTAAVLPFSYDAEASSSKTETKDLPSLKGRKVMINYGGWPGHEPGKYKDYLEPWLKSEGAEVQVFDKLNVYTDKSVMDNIDLIIQSYTMAQLTPEQEKGLLETVEKNGTGMAGCHGGMCDSFRSSPGYQFMTGGQWTAHPGGQMDYTVNIIDHKDEVTGGLKDFKIHTEQYYMLVDPNIKVLATTTFNGDNYSWINGSIMPVTWKKMYGKGRIFYTSIGHSIDHITSSPESLAMLQRGIKWASASKYAPVENLVNAVYKK